MPNYFGDGPSSQNAAPQPPQNNLGTAMLSAIPAVGGLLSGVVNSIRQNRYERKLREYNSPANQVKRLHEAGISGQAFFDQGNTGNASLQSQPQYGNIGQSYLEGYQSTKLNDLQKNLLIQQVRAAKSQADIMEKDANDYISSGYSKIQTKEADLEYKNTITELNRVKTEWQRTSNALQNDLYDNNIQQAQEKLKGMVQTNRNLGQSFINMVNANEKTSQEILNLITQDAKAKQEISNLVTTNRKTQSEIDQILTSTKYTKELINLAYLDQDEKDQKLKQMVQDLRNDRFEFAAKGIVFDELLKYADNPTGSPLAALPDALLYYGIDQINVGAFVGGIRGKYTGTFKTQNTNTNTNTTKYK